MNTSRSREGSSTEFIKRHRHFFLGENPARRKSRGKRQSTDVCVNLTAGNFAVCKKSYGGQRFTHTKLLRHCLARKQPYLNISDNTTQVILQFRGIYS